MSNELTREKLAAIRKLIIDAVRMIDTPPDLAYRFELGRYGGTLTIFQHLFGGDARPLGELEAVGLLIPLSEMLVSADETAEGLASRIRLSVYDQTMALSDSELRHTAECRRMPDWWLAAWRRHMPDINVAGELPGTKIEFSGSDAFLDSAANHTFYERKHIDDLRELAQQRGLIATGEVLDRDQLIFLLMQHDAMLVERDEAVRRIQEDYVRQQEELNADFKRQVENVNAEFAMRAERWRSDIRRKWAAGEE